MRSDTNQKIKEIYIQKLKRKTDVERAIMGFSMFEASRYLMKVSILKEGMTKKDIKAAIFDRFYGNDFDKITKQKIVKYLKGN